MAIMHIFVISLKRSTKRRLDISRQFSQLNVGFSFFDAIDGRNLSEYHETLVDRESAEKRIGRPLTDPEIACALSHALVYAKMVHEDIPWAIVLEDDVHLHEEIVPILESRVLEKTPYELICLYVPLDARVKFFSRNPFHRSHHLFEFADTPYGASGYVISNAAAKKLHTRVFPISHYADWPVPLHRKSVIKAAGIFPRLVEYNHNAVESDIGGGRTKKHESVRLSRFEKLLKALLLPSIVNPDRYGSVKDLYQSYRALFIRLTSKPLDHHMLNDRQDAL